jgi:hypothetical protein
MTVRANAYWEKKMAKDNFQKIAQMEKIRTNYMTWSSRGLIAKPKPKILPLVMSW